MAVASSRRRLASGGSLLREAWSRLMRAKEVGSTQLLVPGVKPQPRYDLFTGCSSLCVENLARNRRHGVVSPGQSWQSHLMPAVAAPDESAALSRTQQPSEVTQQPDFSSGVEGHDPSAS